MMKRTAQTMRAAALLLLLLFVTSGQAQTPPQTIEPTGAAAAKGTVVGPGNTPQAGIPVQIVGPPGQTVAITDKDGKWSVYNLPAGDYKVKMVGAENADNTKPVTFSVKEKSFWSRVLGSAAEIVTSPEIKVDTVAR